MLNATGVIVHTNLGRAPLAEPALARAVESGRGYSNLELDLTTGTRGSRQDHVAALLRRLTGAEASLVVNNNAAALLLALAALADGREVVVSRGELIEIGDGFRIPEVLERSGARLVEVGTTNRTRAADYDAATGADTALLLRVHQSNFRLVGFAERPALRELAAVARRHELPLLDDLGSGALVDLGDEPTARAALEQGADLVCFSGDKLLGGPQAGVVLGRGDLIERLRRHPLHRALRIDKLGLAALEGTLLLYLDPARALREVPVLRMLHEDVRSVRSRAERLAGSVGGEVEETVARVGGGALPLAELPSFACALEESLTGPLRCRNRRSSGSCATAACCSTAARSPTTSSTRSPRPCAPRARERVVTGGGRLGRAARCPRRPRDGDRRRPSDRRRARSGPRAVEELAGEQRADPETLRRILRALASDGIFTEVEPGVFANTEASEVLRGDGWRDFAHLFGGTWLPAIGALDASGTTDVPTVARDRLLVVACREPVRASNVRPRDGARCGSATRPAPVGRLARRRDDRRRRRRERLTPARAARATSGDARHRLRPAGDGARRSYVRRALPVRRRRLLRPRSRGRRVPPLDDPARLGRRVGGTGYCTRSGPPRSRARGSSCSKGRCRKATSPTAPSGSIC